MRATGKRSRATGRTTEFRYLIRAPRRFHAGDEVCEIAQEGVGQRGEPLSAVLCGGVHVLMERLQGPIENGRAVPVESGVAAAISTPGHHQYAPHGFHSNCR